MLTFVYDLPASIEGLEFFFYINIEAFFKHVPILIENRQVPLH